MPWDSSSGAEPDLWVAGAPGGSRVGAGACVVQWSHE
jgi:hypothetical protein